MKKTLILLLFVSLGFCFTIESYYTDATVLENGDLRIYERILFDLDDEYSEGFRSIRPEDVETLDNLVVDGITLNGETVEFYTQKNGNDYEIVWTETVLGENLVEMNYRLKNRVELWDDYAKVCFEHFGANWNVPAKDFKARMTIPESARGKPLHFEIYSEKKGTATIDDLTITTVISNVPPWNYVGGCYLFAKESVHTSKIVDGSAYDILQNEREIYDSENLEESIPPELCCLPLAILFLLGAIATFFMPVKYPKYPESILPPEKEIPAVVAVLINNETDKEKLIAATILQLINKGVVDIVELEKKETSDNKKERTILLLKKPTAKLESYEKAVIDMIFYSGKKEVDLDAMMNEYKKINNIDEAKKHPVLNGFNTFSNEIDGLLKKYEMSYLAKEAEGRKAKMIVFGTFGLFALLFLSCFVFDGIYNYLGKGMWMNLLVLVIEIILIIGSIVMIGKYCLAPKPPKLLHDKDGNSKPVSRELLEKYGKWKGFEIALKASRINEHPPTSIVIWNDILIYATALGLADKVNQHLSELSGIDPMIATKMKRMNRVRIASYAYASSVGRVKSTSTPASRHRSSRGWSSHGGGGFSRRSSGGGGFR
ncbi:DUF2207 domain-containing protein [Candidatus Micrarchaeota archaeon]|nr:DUF2207 domain-containing protein [Candidatus Micrarchaeota archaeon]MBU1166689.1 DUF2207 domain-containing protein [Candidatus Micrarchaeota archaeon]MBU1886114.1 DUF2207 domain-containing protein [Candidatus Micrarchaeota archaeon]